MSDPRYDFDRETDKEFLREAGKMLQEEVVKLRIEVIQLKLQQAQDEEIKSKLTGELLVLKRRVFDSRQERKEKLKNLKKKKKKNKSNLPHNTNENKSTLDDDQKEISLTSEEVLHCIDDSVCPACGKPKLSELENLFEESTEYDVNTTFYILKRHKRKKYKCKCCDNIVTAKGGVKLAAGGKFSLQMAIQIATDKFGHHLPLERQMKKMKAAGLNVSVKTLFSLTEHLYNILYPLNEMNRQDIISNQYVGIDESPMPFFNKSKSKGQAWTMSNQIGAYYQFEPTRSGDVAKEMIKGFDGVVITDGYTGYDFLSKLKDIIHAYCWSHLRRYFFDAMVENEEAGEVVDLVDELYAIEHDAQSYEEIEYLRKTKSQKVYDNIVAWIEENEGHHLKSELTGKAINYFYNQQEGLSKFLTNKYVPLDNNCSERRQRCPVMGRKNYLYFRSINGADIGMFFYSMIESCKTNGLDPSSYLLDMAIRKLEGKSIETPYGYAKKKKAEILQGIKEELSGLSPNNSS